MKDCPKYVEEGGNIHAEIEYMKDDNTPVHSDICPAGCSMTGVNSNYKFHVLNALTEWLNKSNGTGYFYVGNWDDIAEAFGHSMIEVEDGTKLHV